MSGPKHNPGKLKRLATVFLLTLAVFMPACRYLRDFDFERGAKLTGGNPEAGRKKLAQRSCVSCHVIPGVPHGEGKSGPSLAHWYGRSTFLNGAYQNTPTEVEKWLDRPSHRKRGTNMPDIDLSPQESRDMVAYLFSIN